MPDLEKIFLKVTSNPSSLVWIDELKAFYQKFEGKSEYKNVRYECESLMSTIYQYAGFFEKSFEIDLRLLKEYPADMINYWGTIERAVVTSDRLERTTEVIPSALNYLNTPDDDSSKKPVVLRWYATMFANKENSFFETFDHIVKNMELFLEERTDPALPFAERINYLNDKYMSAIVASNSFAMAYSKANKEERNQLIKDYLATKPLKYYREILKTYD